MKLGSHHAIKLALTCSIAVTSIPGFALANDSVTLPAVKVTVSATNNTPSQPSAATTSGSVTGLEGAAAVEPKPAPTEAEGRVDLPRCKDGEVPREKIAEMIRVEASRQGADAKLALAIAHQESDYGQKNNSEAGARGPMQLLASTAASYQVTDICNAEQNIRGGIAFLKDLNVEFGGNIYLQLAAYNAGSKRVYASRGVPPIRETVNYVAVVANEYFDFDNALQRSRKGRSAKAAIASADSDITGSTNAEGRGILPVNAPRATPPAVNQWIGGVLNLGE